MERRFEPCAQAHQSEMSAEHLLMALVVAPDRMLLQSEGFDFTMRRKILVRNVVGLTLEALVTVSLSLPLGAQCNIAGREDRHDDQHHHTEEWIKHEYGDCRTERQRALIEAAAS